MNEAERISEILDSVPLSTIDEVLVVDGGSTDDTLHLAKAKGVKTILAQKPGRAAQLNEGAKTSLGNVLLFLHADTIISRESVENMRHALEAETDLCGGGFLRRFDSDSVFLKLTCWLSDFRSRWSGWFLGDQAIFVRRDVFEKMGGFDEEIPIGEDLDFSVRLSDLFKVSAIRPAIISSARRFERQGEVRQTWNDFWAGWRIIRRTKRNQRG